MLQRKVSGPLREELEAAIASQPDDPNAYLVYADWLQARGDPRGELIVLQHRAAGGDKDAGQAARKLLREHQDTLVGSLEGISLTWEFGFVAEARTKTRNQLLKVLAHPSAMFLRRLRVAEQGHLAGTGPIPSLRSLAVGRAVGKVRLSGYPRLQELELAGPRVSLRRLRLADLRVLRLRVEEVTEELLASVPETLTTLDVERRFSEVYGRDAREEEDAYTAPRLDCLERLPALTTLRLVNLWLTGDTLRSLPELSQLQHLDVSGSKISDRDADELPASLQSLGVSRCELSEERIAELEQSVPTVEAANQLKTPITVWLLSYPSNKKISTIKVLRMWTGLGLRVTKEMADDVPSRVRQFRSRWPAEQLLYHLEEIGAVGEVR